MADYDEFMKVVLDEMADEEIAEDIDIDEYSPEGALDGEDLAMRAYDEFQEETDTEHMFDFQLFD